MGEPLTCTDLHHEGMNIATGGMYGGLYLYDLRMCTKPKMKFIGHDGQIRCVDFSKNAQINKTESETSSLKEISEKGKSNEPQYNNFVKKTSH